MARAATSLIGALALCVLLAPGASAATASEDRALALRFRPHLLFDSQERWRPLDVDRFLAEPGHLVCPPAGAPCAPLLDPAVQLTAGVDHLDLRGDGPDDETRSSTIYAHVVHGRRRIAIDYWWFLRFNAYSLDRHEGDWEGVTVIADRRGERVLDVHFAAHADVWRYRADVRRVVRGRVRVFVTRGGHAAYPRPCMRRCRQTEGTLPEARFDGAAPWVGNTSRGCRGRCVRLLPQRAGAPASWNAWQGRWGVTTTPAFAAPLTPAFQARFQHPFSARRSARDIF